MTQFSVWLISRPIRPVVKGREKTFEEFVEEQLKVEEITQPKQQQVQKAYCSFTLRVWTVTIIPTLVTIN